MQIAPCGGGGGLEFSLPTASKDFSSASGYLLATRLDNVHLEGLITYNERVRIYEFQLITALCTRKGSPLKRHIFIQKENLYRTTRSNKLTHESSSIIRV
jgi:hypothetical protein